MMSEYEYDNVTVHGSSPGGGGAVVQRYPCSCHCGRIRYTITLSPPLHDPGSWVVECNCSICSRNGYLNVYVRKEAIEWEDPMGLDAASVEKYRFARPTQAPRIQHYFCGHCGSSLMCESIEPGFYDGVVAVNVRMFHNIDIQNLQRREVDGRGV